MTADSQNIFERPLQQCNNCKYWYRAGLTSNSDGCGEALCMQPTDARDQKMRRGSDRCQHWQKKGIA